MKDLMSADIADVSTQLEIQLQGRTAVDHIPEGLSTLNQYLLYREQLLENPYPDQWVMAPWQALRTNAGRAMLIRKYQRPFSSLKDPERDRCARYLLSLFSEPVPANSIGRSEFFCFIDCILQSRLNYERHLTEGATWFQRVFLDPLLLPKIGTCGPMPPPEKEQQAYWPQAKSCSQIMQLHVWIRRRTPIPFMGEVLPIQNGTRELSSWPANVFTPQRTVLEWFSLACCLRAMSKEKVHPSVMKITCKVPCTCAAPQTAAGQ